VRRGSHGAFETLVGRYQSRLLAFCRHMLGSKEDAEDVLQEVFAAAFNAILADDRPINVRPWLYRIARNRSLNHLRRVQAIGVDSMDIHIADHGTTTADKVHSREEFRQLLADVGLLPETQRTALLLREIDDLSYEQIAEAMETTIPSVKSLLVRARVSLAEAAEARLLSCEEVRLELGEIAEGIKRRTSPPVRRHLRTCDRCATFRGELRTTSKALAVVLPVGPLLIAKKLFLAHLGWTASAGSHAAGGTAGAAAGTAVASSAATGGSSLISAGLGAVATKAAAGIAAAALVTAGAVEVDHSGARHHRSESHPVAALAAVAPLAIHHQPVVQAAPSSFERAVRAQAGKPKVDASAVKAAKKSPVLLSSAKATLKPTTALSGTTTSTTATPAPAPAHTEVESDTTTLPAVLPPPTTTGASTPPATTTTPSPPTATTPAPTTAASPPPPPPATTSTTPPPPPPATSDSTTTTPTSSPPVVTPPVDPTPTGPGSPGSPPATAP
jgi:RNA polymerase sigma factor (sigma-70 family)